MDTITLNLKLWLNDSFIQSMCDHFGVWGRILVTDFWPMMDQFVFYRNRCLCLSVKTILTIAGLFKDSYTSP